MTFKLIKIDDSNRSHHHFLENDDACFYLREYTSGATKDAHLLSATNSLIINFKKSPLKKNNKAEWRYKLNAIEIIAKDLSDSLMDILEDCTLVPIPPSKIKSNPEHDDRMLKVLQAIQINNVNKRLDIRELLLSKNDTQPSHMSGSNRATIEEIKSNTIIDVNLCTPVPTNILLFDDVLTTGRHFKACKAVLLNSFPKAMVFGIFIARVPH
jgi:predicted amidophosphoribosyltransferase